jgi:hypothetical protein
MSRALPEGYVAKQIRVIDNDSWIHVVASTPFKTHVEYMVPMPEGIKTQAGICPLCVSDMKLVDVGSYVCVNNHVPVFMKTATASPKLFLPPKRLKSHFVPKRMPKREPRRTLMYGSGRNANPENVLDKQDIKTQVADALEEYL